MGALGDIGKGTAKWYATVIAGIGLMAVVSFPIFYLGELAKTYFELSDDATTWVMFGLFFGPLIAAAWWVGLRDDRPSIIPFEVLMRWLRFLLMALTAAVLGLFAYLLATHGPPRKGEAWATFGVGAGLVLNFIYLWLNVPNGKPWRLVKLFQLWMDAKEAELKRRTTAGHEQTR